MLFINANSQLIEKIEFDLLKYSKNIYDEKTSDLKNEFLFLNEVDFYKIKYKSDSLIIDGMIIMPKKDTIFPTIVYNKGGNNFHSNNIYSQNANQTNLIDHSLDISHYGIFVVFGTL